MLKEKSEYFLLSEQNHYQPQNRRSMIGISCERIRKGKCLTCIDIQNMIDEKYATDQKISQSNSTKRGWLTMVCVVVHQLIQIS